MTTYLRIAGRLREDNSLALRPCYTLESRGTPTADRENSLVVEMVDGAGRTIGQWRIPLRTYADAGTTGYSARGDVPMREDAVRAVIRRPTDGPNEDAPLAELDLTGPTPQVRFTEFEISGDMLRCAWEASGDPRPIEYLVHVSNTGGETWRAASFRLTEPRHEIDLSSFPGGENCAVRVLASNGVRSGIAVSERFALRERPCECLILQPSDGARVPASAVTLVGSGWWAEDERFADEELTWHSDRDGELGRGATIVVALSPGEHVLTVVGGERERQGRFSVTVTAVQGPEG